MLVRIEFMITGTFAVKTRISNVKINNDHKICN